MRYNLANPSPQEQSVVHILPQSTSAQRPSLVLQLFKRAVDGSLDSRGPEVDISVHSNTSGEQECVSAKNVILNATSGILLGVLFIYFLQEKEGWAAEKSRSETNAISARHSRGPSARLR